MLKVRRPERKMSGFRTVRIPRILWTSGLDIMFGRALIWTNNCKIIWPEIKWPLKILKISENLFSKLILHDQECWIPPECKINLLYKFLPICKVNWFQTILFCNKYLAHVNEQPIFRIPNLEYLQRNFCFDFFNDSENTFWGFFEI